MTFNGSLEALYKGNKKVFSLEFFPPKNQEGMSAAKEVIAHCAEMPVHYMTVTYGAGGTTQDLTNDLLMYIHRELKKPVMSHLTCVGHSVQEIDERLAILKQIGIPKILALRGDPPKGVTKFEKHPEGFGCARDLISHIFERNDFAVAAAGYPEYHKEAKSPEDDIRYLKEKVDAGAEIILTQLFFDEKIYFDFLEKTTKAGINIPIVPGIMPIRDVAQCRRFTELCGASIPEKMLHRLEAIKDDKQAVIDYGVEQAYAMCQALLEGGAPGIHFYTLNKSGQVRQLMQALA